MNNCGYTTVEIPFGSRRDSISIATSRLIDVLSPNPKETHLDQRKAIERVLSNPIGCGPIESFVKSTDSIVIISEDISRFARTDIIIEEIVKRLAHVGVPDDQILIVMALGSHRKMTEKEIEHKLGSTIYKRYKSTNSEFRDPSLLTYMGTAPGGVEVLLDKRVANTDIKIGVGSIVPHPALGYTGGAKIVYPGTVGEDTVAQLHLRAAIIDENIMGVVENQARLEMEQWVDTIGLDFIVNSIVTPDNKTYEIVAGHYVEAHRAGVKFAEEIYKIGTRTAVDNVIVSSHTADFDLWQATKAVIGGERIVKDGGRIILYTPCPEGVGPHPEFPYYCKGDKIKEDLANAIKGNFPSSQILPLSVGALIARVQKRIKVEIISPGITAEEAATAGFNYAGSTLADLQRLIDNQDQSSTVSVLTHGGESFSILL